MPVLLQFRSSSKKVMIIVTHILRICREKDQIIDRNKLGILINISIYRNIKCCRSSGNGTEINSSFVVLKLS